MDQIQDMSDDHITLQRVMDRHGITVKAVASWTGLAASTIYRYLIGGQTIPSIIWRVMFERTMDVEIAVLFTGGLPYILVPLVRTDARYDAATLKNLVEMRQKQLDCEKYVLDILSDGQIDGSDRKAIEEFKRTFPEMVRHQAQVFQAVTNAFEVIGATNGGDQ